MDNEISVYDFKLTRAQRAWTLISKAWRELTLAVVGAVCVAVLANISVVMAFLFAVVLLVVFRRLFASVVAIIFEHQMHVEIRDRGILFGRNKTLFWMHCAGIEKIQTNFWGTTTVSHRCGASVDIPTAMLSATDREKLEVGMSQKSPVCE